MFRIFAVSIFAFVCQLFFTAVNVPLGLSGPTVLVAPAALIFAAAELSTIEGLATVVLLGFLHDSWIGAPLGVITALLCVLFLLAKIALSWLGRPDFYLRISFIFLFTLAFRVTIALALGIAGGFFTGNFEWMSLLAMPVLDVAVGLLFYRIIMRFLSLFRLYEIKEDTSQRLSRRSPRIILE